MDFLCIITIICYIMPGYTAHINFLHEVQMNLFFITHKTTIKYLLRKLYQFL